METNYSSRNDAIDIAKGIGILLVILGHLDLSSALSQIIYYFHMPLFFLISGWFLPSGSKPVSFFKKKFKRLMVPYGFMVSIGFVMECIRGYLKTRQVSAISTAAVNYLISALYASGNEENLNPYGIGIVGTLWFLPALVLSSTAVYIIINKIRRSKARFSVVIIIFSVSWWTARFIWLPLSLQAAGCATLFILSGWQIKQLLTRLQIKQPDAKKCMFMIAVSICMLVFEYVNNMRVLSVCAIYTTPLITVPFAIFVSYSIVRASSAVSSHRKQVLSYIGKNSLIIYCSHYCGIYCFSGLQYFGFTHIFENSCVGIVLLYIVYMAIQFVFAISFIFLANTIAPFGRIFGMHTNRC